MTGHPLSDSRMNSRPDRAFALRRNDRSEDVLEARWMSAREER